MTEEAWAPCGNYALLEQDSLSSHFLQSLWHPNLILWNLQEFLTMPFYLVHKEVRFTEHIVQVELAFFSCSFSIMSESKESSPTAFIILHTFACSLKFHKVAHIYSFFTLLSQFLVLLLYRFVQLCITPLNVLFMFFRRQLRGHFIPIIDSFETIHSVTFCHIVL